MKIYECILSLIAGIGVFILAMKLMSDALNRIAGESMKRLLQKLAGNRIVGVLIGALVTAVIQSSSATTVMVIGFVNADVMNLNQAAAIIIGSNIGTTVTGLLASLESLNISLYLSLLVFIGVMLAFIKKIKKYANLMTGLGMIFVGLKMMSSACDDKSIKDAFGEVLSHLQFPLLLELLGIIFTAIIQSSSAMTGIVIVMVGKKVMTMKSGLFITLGANIGTCVTALLGIIGANTNSKRTALIHFIFNMSGCIIFTPILWIFSDQITALLEKMSKEDSMRIAYFHLFFNILTAIVTTPLIKYLVKLVTWAIKDKDETQEQLEWFIQDRDREPLIDTRPTSTSIDVNNISTNDKDEHKIEDLNEEGNLIINDFDKDKKGLFEHDSSNLSEDDNLINNDKNENDNDKVEIKKEEKQEEIKEEKPEEKQEEKPEEKQEENQEVKKEENQEEKKNEEDENKKE
jgi:phosphate:Na+ symporter